MWACGTQECFCMEDLAPGKLETLQEQERVEVNRWLVMESGTKVLEGLAI